MKALHSDSNMTDNHKDTAWMNSVDPLYAKIADEWMQQLIGDFGTDHGHLVIKNARASLYQLTLACF